MARACHSRALMRRMHLQRRWCGVVLPLPLVRSWVLSPQLLSCVLSPLLRCWVLSLLLRWWMLSPLLRWWVLSLLLWYWVLSPLVHYLASSRNRGAPRTMGPWPWIRL